MSAESSRDAAEREPYPAGQPTDDPCEACDSGRRARSYLADDGENIVALCDRCVNAMRDALARRPTENHAERVVTDRADGIFEGQVDGDEVWALGEWWPMKKPPLITAEQLAERLGVSVSLVYQLARREQIPCYKAGGTWRFDEMEVKAVMRREKAS